MTDIKILVLDVDGTLTDGKIYISSQGEIMKAFNVKDGLGIRKLQQKGIIPVIITGRNSEIVSIRGGELGISEIYQGIEDKLTILDKICMKYSCNYKAVAYIGDDENDLECMNVCGIKGCPSDAVESVKNIADIVCKTCGGNGAVREFIEYLIHQH